MRREPNRARSRKIVYFVLVMLLFTTTGQMPLTRLFSLLTNAFEASEQHCPSPP